MKGNYRF
jgi:hypothetical protein